IKNMEMYTLDTAMIRLKEIAEELESGEHDLEMSMKLYEEGVRIITFCNKALSNARQKVVELSEYDNEEDENEEGVQL
ncbi:MAG: exodeoxyribonuclease VII small subunit, partial [Clostridia bacterium]|nr:exodeoxyribonuclease VII small subunit [Clostridia bacterium]